MADYDIIEAFREIENELISSMIRNLDHHRARETAEGIQWTQWQTEQLNAFEQYKKHNQKKFGKQFQSINNNINSIIREHYSDGQTKQERKILQAIKRGYKINGTNKPAFTGKAQTDGEFFGINSRKLESLITATTHDMQRAETAVLRLANDNYRKAIFNAQIYAQTGGTYEKAVDMATRDMLKAGLNCIEYKNGARHTLSSYSEMALRTSGTRAYLQGEGSKREEWGIHTVILNQRSCPCPLCLPFVGKVFVDDVWSGGTAEESQKTGYPLLSEAMAEGLYHPNCKDIHTTYFEGITTKNKSTTDEKKQLIKEHNIQQKANYSKNQAEKYERMSKYSLNEENKKIYKARAEQWSKKEKIYSDNMKSTTIEKQKVFNSSNNFIMGNSIISGVANLGDSGIIEFKDNNSLYKPVTIASINRVPRLNIFQDSKLNSLHRNASINLLMKVFKSHDPVGTEFSIVYGEDMKPIGKYDKQGNKIGTYTYHRGIVGSTKIDNPGVPYHAFHNHGSGETFSFSDVLGFARSDNMISLTAVGNTGSKFVIYRNNNSDNLGYENFISDKSKEIIYSVNGTDFTFQMLYDIQKGKIGRDIMDVLSDKQLNELKCAMLEKVEECLKGGEKYGIKYISSKT